MLEEWVIHFASSGRIHSEEESFPLILKNSFFQVFFVFEVCRLFKRLKQGGVLNWVLRNKAFNMLLHLQAIGTTVYIWSHYSIWLDACSLDSISKRGRFLPLAIEALHPVLDLIERLLLSIESFYAS